MGGLSVYQSVVSHLIIKVKPSTLLTLLGLKTRSSVGDKIVSERKTAYGQH